MRQLAKQRWVRRSWERMYPGQQASSADVDVCSRLLCGVTGCQPLPDGLGRGHIICRLGSVWERRQREAVAAGTRTMEVLTDDNVCLGRSLFDDG